jgi:hypothetical protein
MKCKNLSLLFILFSFALPTSGQDLSSLLSRFQSENDRSAKENILMAITEHYPNAGPELLRVASEAQDDDTRWLAIRGLGTLKFGPAANFLKQSLSSQNSFVRANSARALGEIHDYSAIPELIRLFEREKDAGVLEQTSLAFLMLNAKEAVPVLKAKAKNPSPQTQGWILGAIGRLGSRNDVTFLANFLYDKDQNAAMAAASAIEKLTGLDFGFPKTAGPVEFSTGIRNARAWWEANRASWR